MAEKFEQWAILEIMGHQTYAGMVSEQSVGGASFVRIDVPETEGQPAFTKLFGAASIYCISPVTEEVGRMMAKRFRKEPVSVYDLPEDIQRRLRQPALAGPSAHEDEDLDEPDYDEHDDGYQM